MFFWLLEAKELKNNLIVWLNGGPGCSSMDGLFLENGPFRISEKGVSLTEYGWWKHANILYGTIGFMIVDQPIGTGYSLSTTFRKNMSEIVQDFVDFMDIFFETFPQYRSSNLYLAGESFAGQYIPYIGQKFIEKNLKGLIIGNGWIDPLRQYASVIEYAIRHKLLSGVFLESAQKRWKECQQLFATGGDLIKYDVCESLVQVVLDESKSGGKYCLNMYDIRLRDNGPNEGCGLSWPKGLDLLGEYLSNHKTSQALHMGNVSWQECTSGVFNALRNDKSMPSYRLLPELLAKVPVHLYSGDQDLICNWIGTRNMINEMTWNGKKGFDDAKTKYWYINNTLRGTITTDRNLGFYLMYNTSHMAPVDNPDLAFDMINRILSVNDNSLFDSKLGDDVLNVRPPQETSILPIVMISLSIVVVAFFVGIFLQSKLKHLWLKKLVERHTIPTTEWESIPDFDE